MSKLLGAGGSLVGWWGDDDVPTRHICFEKSMVTFFPGENNSRPHTEGRKLFD
jgi:hypothetical protein